MGSSLNKREWNSPALVGTYVKRGAPAAQAVAAPATPPVPATPAPPAPPRQPHPVEALLPSVVGGLSILDVACADGGFSRVLAGRGAKVTGVDISEVFIARANDREEQAPLGITYATHDLMEPLPESLGTFDVAVSIMTVMDVEDPIAAVRHICRAVKPGGLFAFTLPHPCFFRPTVKEEEAGLGSELPRAVDWYYDRTRVGSRRIVAKDGSGRTASYSQFHRPLGDYLGALIEEGFCLERFVEPGDTILLISARKHH